MGAASYTQAQTFDGHQAVGIAVFQLPDTNALDVADRVKAKMKELEPRFPEGIKYEIAYDITPFIRESVWDVVKTLFEAVFLVGLVVLAFLQNWRSVLIPMVAVPVAIIGTFAAMAVMRYSLNNISLFGLVLAIGIVVDDAIVVVENVDRWLDHGLPPREAAEGHDGGHRPDHRRGAGAVRGVRALRVHQRNHRPVLQAVRGDDRCFHRLFGHQLADTQPGLGRDPAGKEKTSRDPGDRSPADPGCMVPGWRDCGRSNPA